MKRNIIVLFAFAEIITSINSAFAQNNLHAAISTGSGVSKRFVTLEKKQQVKFDAKYVARIFDLNKNSDLVLLNTETDKIGFIHYRYYQTFRGYPIENSMYIVHTKNGLITGATGSIITEFYNSEKKDSTKPTSSGQAINIALNYMPATKYAWQDADMQRQIQESEKNTQASYFPVATKVWFCPDDTLNARNLRLCYKIDVYSLQPLDRKFIFVDVQTGRVIGSKQRLRSTDATGTAVTSYSGIQTIHSDRTGKLIYRLRDLTKGKGIITLHGAKSHLDYTNATRNWKLFGEGQYALDVHFGVSSTWSFYHQHFNRNSIDNKGLALTSWVNLPFLDDNAHWDGSVMAFGVRTETGDVMASIDIVGHELTHGVTDYTSGLVYSKESGAIDESMSDIMGKCVQFFTKPNDINWSMGNDMKFNFRSFSDPNFSLRKQPDTYKGVNWQITEGCFPNSSKENDFCGVHTNSGIGNFMFYLLVNGGDGQNDNFNDYSVSGIGLEKAAQIIYRTETVYLTPTSQYVDWWNACKAAASDLFGSASNELKQVENAWFAVGFGNPLVLNLDYVIIRPVVNKSMTIYDGIDGHPKIQFKEGDEVTLIAGGCVQTAGVGLTWKRFAMPQGPNSDRLYFCTVDISGLTPGVVPLRSLDGGINAVKPDEFTTTFTGRIPAGLSVSQRFFRMGYQDDVYRDNGYGRHDNGTGDQCKLCGDAFMRVIIKRKVAPLIVLHPE